MLLSQLFRFYQTHENWHGRTRRDSAFADGRPFRSGSAPAAAWRPWSAILLIFVALRLRARLAEKRRQMLTDQFSTA